MVGARHAVSVYVYGSAQSILSASGVWRTRHAVSLHCSYPAFSFLFPPFRFPFLDAQFPHVHVGKVLADIIVQVLVGTVQST